ncbi:MAG: DinB family protein [Deltaproteobacteria bacterium]|nr:MAG: DinB family protein [Deltaproteobacteria bacterium]
MLSELRDQLDIYDQSRRLLLGDLLELNAEQLRRKPDAGSWSILETIQHLVLSEREVLQDLPEPKELIARKRGPRARLSYLLVFLVLRWNIPAPVPSDGMVPNGNTSISELSHQWDENLRWMRDYLDTSSPEDLQRAVFRHPIAGPMTAVQTVRMAKLHFDIHLRQISNVKAFVNSKLATQSNS